jgi:hypothetical protein
MKKLTFGEILNYLEAGEDDPRFEQFVRDDPDGARMLEEARRLYALIQEQAEADGGDDDSAGILKMSVAESAPSEIYGEALAESLSVSDELFENDISDLSSKDIMIAAKLGQRAAGRIRNLGELTIAARDTDMLLTFEPTPARVPPWQGRGKPPTKDEGGSRTFYQSAPMSRKQQPDKKMMDFLSQDTTIGDLKIRGAGFEISAPGTQEHYETIQLRVTDTHLRTPARGLELIFMPEHGPFTKVVTDSKGFVELPLPEQPGVLRIEGTVPQHLNINIKY